jgi:hypothetical protein
MKNIETQKRLSSLLPYPLGGAPPSDAVLYVGSGLLEGLLPALRDALPLDEWLPALESRPSLVAGSSSSKEPDPVRLGIVSGADAKVPASGALLLSCSALGSPRAARCFWTLAAAALRASKRAGTRMGLET